MPIFQTIANTKTFSTNSEIIRKHSSIDDYWSTCLPNITMVNKQNVSCLRSQIFASGWLQCQCTATNGSMSIIFDWQYSIFWKLYFEDGKYNIFNLIIFNIDWMSQYYPFLFGCHPRYYNSLLWSLSFLQIYVLCTSA